MTACRKRLFLTLVFMISTWSLIFLHAQTDTLRVFSYSILYQGDRPPCQGPHNIYEGYIESILSYARPDIVGFVKREPEDAYGTAPVGYADSLLRNCFNTWYAGAFAYCPYTNYSGGSNISTLYYNQNKLGYAGLLCTYSNITDFDTYKLYYKSDSLAETHDTIFLYVTLNHDNSGSSSGSAATRATQIEGEMAQIDGYFTHLPNMINMGDFNTQNSSEACYQALVAPADTNYKYNDPPFYPDGSYSYPGSWDTDPAAYAAILTVSTHTSSNTPDGCSSNVGGGKAMYDHIFLSANIINNADHISYIPHSFTVIGNDGNRVGNPVNTSPANTSAPPAVINAVYQMSEHYPLMLDLLVNAHTNAVPVINNEEKITVVNPVADQLVIHTGKGLAGKKLQLTATDVLGRNRLNTEIFVSGSTIQLPCNWLPGIYLLSFSCDGQMMERLSVSKL